MLISNSTINKLEIIIEKYMDAMIVIVAGKDSVSKARLKMLIDLGLVSEKTEPIINRAYWLGKLKSTGVSEAEAEVAVSEIKTAIISKLTKHEVAAVKLAESTVARELIKYKETVKGVVADIALSGNYTYRNASATAANVLEENLAQKTSLQQIATQLRDKTLDIHRDWKRVVSTEMTNTMNMGAVDNIIRENKGKQSHEIYCYKSIPLDAHTCLEENEKVVLVGNKLVAIGNLKIGDKLLNHSNVDSKHRGKLKYSVVNYLQKKDVECVKITLDNGDIITASKDHPILIKYKSLYTFWEIDNIPEGAEIINVKNLNRNQRYAMTCCLNGGALARRNNCDDLWDFIQKYREQLVAEYKSGIRIIQLCHKYGVSEVFKYKISTILTLSGCKVITGIKNNHHGQALHDKQKFYKNAQIESYKEKIQQMIDDKMGYRDIAKELRIAYGRLLGKLKEWGLFNLSESRRRSAKGFWIKARQDEVFMSKLKLTASRNLLKFAIFGSVPQKLLYDRLKDFWSDTKYNYVVNNQISVDMFIPKENIVVEFDGSGHDMGVRMGSLTHKQLKAKDYGRDKLCKNFGFKVLRIKSSKDKVPDKADLISWIDKLKISSHKYLEIQYG